MSMYRVVDKPDKEIQLMSWGLAKPILTLVHKERRMQVVEESGGDNYLLYYLCSNGRYAINCSWPKHVILALTELFLKGRK